MKMIVNYAGRNVHRSEGMFFIPGNNEIDVEVWAAGQRNPLLLKKVESKLLRVVAVPPGYGVDGKVKDVKAAKAHQEFLTAQAAKEDKTTPSEDYVLSELDIADIKDIVAGTLDLGLLADWKEQDERKAVKKLIDDQIAFLNKKNKELVDKK
jgi:hypothetical protein